MRNWTTRAPLTPEFRDYVLDALTDRGDLRKMEVFSLNERLDAWVLSLLPHDKNVVDILEQGMKSGRISISGAAPDRPDGFDRIGDITTCLNTFGVIVPNRIRNQFMPLFDPASEPLSEDRTSSQFNRHNAQNTLR